MAFLLHLLRPEDLFVDIGANIGAYTVLAAAVVGAHCLSFEPVPGTYCHVETLDGVLHERKPKLIKIDVEGYEAEVVAVGSRVLAEPSLLAVIMELNEGGSRYGFDGQLVHRQMLAYGFMPCRYSLFDRALAPLSRKNLIGDNTIYVREMDGVRRLLEEAPKTTIHNKLI